MKNLTLVAIVVTSITAAALWSGLHYQPLPVVPWQDVATSPWAPLGFVLLMRGLCAAVAFYTLFCIYRDPKGFELRYCDAKVHLLGLSRFTTFTTWCFSLLCAYFMLATLCSLAALFGYGPSLPPWLMIATHRLFAISYPLSLLVTTVVSFVLIPTARRHQQPIDRMFRWRPQMMHNGNVLMLQCAMVMTPLPITLAFLPYTVLFGYCYLVFAWYWFWRTRVFYYFFLDYRRPYAVLTYLGLFVALALFYSLACLISAVLQHHRGHWWLSLGILIATLGLTRFRAPSPAAAQLHRSFIK